MTVYVINNLKIHDRGAYGEYLSGFMDGFARLAVAHRRLPRETAEGGMPEGASRQRAAAPGTARTQSRSHA